MASIFTESSWIKRIIFIDNVIDLRHARPLDIAVLGVIRPLLKNGKKPEGRCLKKSNNEVQLIQIWRKNISQFVKICAIKKIDVTGFCSKLNRELSVFNISY